MTVPADPTSPTSPTNIRTASCSYDQTSITWEHDGQDLDHFVIRHEPMGGAGARDLWMIPGQQRAYVITGTDPLLPDPATPSPVPVLYAVNADGDRSAGVYVGPLLTGTHRPAAPLPYPADQALADTGDPHTVQITWTYTPAPAAQGAPALLYFEIEELSGSRGWVFASRTGGPDARTAVFLPDDPDAAHSWRVVAVHQNGSRLPSGIVGRGSI